MENVSVADTSSHAAESTMDVMDTSDALTNDIEFSSSSDLSGGSDILDKYINKTSTIEIDLPEIITSLNCNVL